MAVSKGYLDKGVQWLSRPRDRYLLIVLALEETPVGRSTEDPDNERSAHQQNCYILTTQVTFTGRNENFYSRFCWMSTLSIAMVSYQVQITSCKKVCLEVVLTSIIEYTYCKEICLSCFPIIHVTQLYELHIRVGLWEGLFSEWLFVCSLPLSNLTMPVAKLMLCLGIIYS